MVEKIQVVEYDERWPQFFTQIRDQVWPKVEDFALAVEHVGSTAVPGLLAKPIIDLDIIVKNDEDSKRAIAAIVALGYVHRGDLGIGGGEAFKVPVGTTIPHHLYVCLQNSVALQNHLRLRDFLRAHPEQREAYAKVKKRLAETFSDSIDDYVEGKTEFILEVLRLAPAAKLGKADLTESDLQSIRRANKSSLDSE